MNKFLEGDIVRLISGSPKLVVELTRRDENVAVVWFDGSTLQRDVFHPDALELECEAV